MRKYIIPLIFFAVMYVFYGFVRPEWCNFHEQYQLFLFSWEYLTAHLSVASGLADYLGEFVVQFFYYPWLGAVFFAALLTGIAVVENRLISICSKGADFNPAVGYILPVIISIYACDENVMVSFPVSILMALLFAWGYSALPLRNTLILRYIMIPVVYWMLGCGVLLFMAVAVWVDYCRKGCQLYKSLLDFVLGVLVYVVSALIVSRTAMLQYPMVDIFVGVDYYRARMTVPVMQNVVLALAFAAIPAARLVPCAKSFYRYSGWLVLAVLLVAGCRINTDRLKTEAMYVDYLVRIQDWQGIIAFCEKNPPSSDLVCNGLNLALAKTNQLQERIFHFNQYGGGSLMSLFELNMVSSVISAETCYHLGLVNTFMRIIFDSQEAILNCNKSGRFYQRLAEAFIVCGDYETASQYSDKLRHTLFYSRFSSMCDDCYANHDLVLSNPSWNAVRSRRLDVDWYYSTVGLSDMLVALYQHCPDNTMALHYALANDLLTGDMDHFIDYFPLTQGGRDTDFGYVPRVYQEALAFVLYQRTGSLQGMPYFISAPVVSDLSQFVRLYTTAPGSDALHNGFLSKTFWSYIVGNN